MQLKTHNYSEDKNVSRVSQNKKSFRVKQKRPDKNLHGLIK